MFYWSYCRDAGRVTIGIGRFVLHLWPYPEFRGWGWCPPADPEDLPELNVFGLGSVAILCWAKGPLEAPLTLPRVTFLNSPLVDRRITFYPGAMPLAMRLRFALAIVPAYQLRFRISQCALTTPAPPQPQILRRTYEAN